MKKCELFLNFGKLTGCFITLRNLSWRNVSVLEFRKVDALFHHVEEVELDEVELNKVELVLLSVDFELVGVMLLKFCLRKVRPREFRR